MLPPSSTTPRLIKRTDNKTWCIQGANPDTGDCWRRSLKTKIRSEAEIRYKEQMVEAGYKHLFKDITIIEALLDYRREVDVADAARLRSCIIALTEFFKDEHELYTIGIPDCRAYVKYRTLFDISPGGIARELSVLKAATHHALKMKRLTLDKMPQFELPTGQVKSVVWLLEDETRKLLDSAQGEMLWYVTLLYYTASRRNAIEQLKWTQVNMAHRTINLAKSGERITNKRRPTIPMGKELFDLLNEIPKTSDYVLGDARDRGWEFEKFVKDIGLLNLPERDGRPAGKLTPHVLRHSRATHLLERNVGIYSVARLLGDSVTTVQRRYGHVSMSSLAEELEKGAI